MCRSIYDTSPFPAAAYLVYYNLVVHDVGCWILSVIVALIITITSIKRRMIVRKIHIRRSVSVKHNFDH